MNRLSDTFSGPCPHPVRDGRHEVYLDRSGTYCRACGARGPKESK
jgi:hypothetical protein